jgi:hypothetical protein
MAAWGIWSFTPYSNKMRYAKEESRIRTLHTQRIARRIYGAPRGHERGAYPAATRIEERDNGDIEVWFDRIFLARYKKGEFLTHWPVVKERPRATRKRSK